jgi:hypothetical protein
MAISKIAGQMLKDNLERDGANLAISDTVADTPVVFVDVVNSRVGVNNATPTQALDIVGNVIANNLFSSSTVSAVGNIIGGNVNTAGAMSATGNSTANFFIGNGSQLTGIDATSIQNGNSNVKVYANANVATSVGGNANVFVVTGHKIATAEQFFSQYEKAVPIFKMRRGLRKANCTRFRQG